MTDPFESMQAEVQNGAVVTPEGGVEEPQGPGLKDRVVELFLPCPEDPLAAKGGISQWINGRLAARSGVPVEKIQVGENVAHCINHLFPGGGSVGWPPIVNLARSILAYRDEAHKNPDNGPVVRR